MGYIKRFLFFSILLSSCYQSMAQPSIKDLDFLVGTWQVEEHNKNGDWWEKGVRSGTYILENQYIQLETVSTSSTGKKRIYRFIIHFDNKSGRFEMICIYSNWPKVQTEILEWDGNSRELTFKSKPDSEEYSERLGTMKLNADLNEYTWTGVNKSGDPLKPRIFEYEEKGKRLK